MKLCLPFFKSKTQKEYEKRNGPGRQKLWGMFGLSYASFMVLPRVMMHDMPDKWQKRMAKLLEEFADEYPNFDEPDYLVQSRGENGSFQKIRAWLTDYRFPDHGELDRARGK